MLSSELYEEAFGLGFFPQRTHVDVIDRNARPK